MPIQSKTKVKVTKGRLLKAHRRVFVPHSPQSFAEEGQSLDMKFCWAKLTMRKKDEFGIPSEWYTGLTDFLQCKDFLHDHVVADDFKTSFNIFSYPASEFKVKTRDDLLLITKTSDCVPVVYEARLAACFRQFEKVAGLESEICQVKWQNDGKMSVAISPDPLYFKAPFGISMLSYLCRITLLGGVWPDCIDAVAALQLKDTGIAKTIKSFGAENLAEQFRAALEAATYPEQFSEAYIKSHTSEVHFNGGIQSTLNATLQKQEGTSTPAHYGKLFKCSTSTNAA